MLYFSLVFVVVVGFVLFLSALYEIPDSYAVPALKEHDLEIKKQPRMVLKESQKWQPN